MGVYRGFFVWGASIVVLLGAFLIFVLAGWPGSANSCISDSPDSCYCESFDRAQAVSGEAGVRQPVNTWFNLYSILTSLLVGAVVYSDRISGGGRNPIRSDSWIPDFGLLGIVPNRRTALRTKELLPASWTVVASASRRDGSLSVLLLARG